jgi:hypothetical protein
VLPVAPSALEVPSEMESSCVVAISSLVSCTATAVLVAVTSVYAVAAWKQQRASVRQVEESRNLRWDSLRPLLVVTTRRTRTTDRYVFELTNVGPGPALGIGVEVDGKGITDFFFEPDEDLLGGWTGPCEVLPSGRTRRFLPAPGTGTEGVCEVRVFYSSLYESVARFEFRGSYSWPKKL